MTNQTNSSSLSFDIFSANFVICERINASAIMTENLVVAVCLFTHRQTFRKQEVWLHLVCLNIIHTGKRFISNKNFGFIWYACILLINVSA